MPRPCLPLKRIRRTPFRILISVLLSARTKDAVTGAAVERLFKAAPTPARMARLSPETLRRLIYPVGFYRQKARHIAEICRRLAAAGHFPDTLEELLELPGVGRKTANLVLALAFQQPAIAVDTHVFRISRRLDWARGGKPQQVEEELQRLFPRRRWRRINGVLVGFGQTVCRPLRPLCPECILRRLCPYFKKHH